MKDFTKTQPKRNDRVGAVKCNTCNYEVRSFGVEPGAACPNPDEDCAGRLMKVDDAASDNAKRRSDGAA